MLFVKKIEPKCRYCQRGTSSGEEQILCAKKGVMPLDAHCTGFRYDPLKRIPIPPIMPDFSQLKDEDFSL